MLGHRGERGCVGIVGVKSHFGPSRCLTVLAPMTLTCYPQKDEELRHA